MILAGYLASVLMGVVLGLIGGGGSILTVPILVYLFALDPMLATAYSLFIVGFTALIGGVQAFRRGDVELVTGLIFAAPSFLGVYLTRAWLVPALPEVMVDFGRFELTKALFIMLLFALLMVVSSISMIRGKKKKDSATKAELSPFLRYGLIGLEGLVVGSVTGLVGAGGGFLIIPALVVLVGLSMKKAVGTSLLIIAAKSLLGFLGDVQQGVVLDWAILGGASAAAAVGILVGGLLASRVPEGPLKKGFGVFVLVMGSGILIDQLRQILDAAPQ